MICCTFRRIRGRNTRILKDDLHPAAVGQHLFHRQRVERFAVGQMAPCATGRRNSASPVVLYRSGFPHQPHTLGAQLKLNDFQRMVIIHRAAQAQRRMGNRTCRSSTLSSGRSSPRARAGCGRQRRFADVLGGSCRV